MVVVTHGGWLHAAYYKAMGRACREKMENCCLGVVRVETGQSRQATWALMSWGDTLHLESVSTTGFGGSSAGV